MRKLVILRGSMGCGKSTWLKENNLEQYTLCADTMRLHLTAPQIGINGKDIIPQKENKQAWDMLFYFLEERMKRGEFTIIDAVHSKSSELSRYKSLAEKYRYRLYCVDFTDIPKEVAKERNKQRPEYKQVPEPEIDEVYSRFETQGKTSGFIVVKPEEFFTKVVNTEPFDWNKYKNIHVFGDIHGCYEPLKEYFEKYPYNEEDGYIFVGDYFDRGLQNVEVFNFLFELSEKGNVLLLTGNHEQTLFNYAFEMPVRSKEFLNKTAIQFIEAGIDKSMLRQFYRKLAQIAYISFRGGNYLITHGGVPYIPKQSLDFYSTDSFVRGIGNYEDDVDKIFDEWVENTKIKSEFYCQIHGHRNLYCQRFGEYIHSLNLEDKIEFGGNLRVAQLLDDGTINQVEVKNNYFDEDLLKQKEESSGGFVENRISSVGMLIQELRNSKYIKEKMLGDGISSFNFTHNAFEKGIWDSITTKARGLFIDVTNEKIQARSYNKFFNKEEKPETRFGYLVQNLKFPVNFYKKENGFLGILSLRNDELYFCSKSTNQGDFVEYFKNVFYQNYNIEQIEAIKDRLRKEDITMVFEVIDPINDPHIIKYEKRDLILLDMIYNKIDFSKVKYDHLKAFGNRNNIKVKELAYTVNTVQEFLSLNGEIQQDDYKLNGEYIEGFVVEDAEGFMFKYKLNYYNTWKSLRWVLQRYLKNPTSVNTFTQTLTKPVENYFLAFLRKKYPEGTITQADIIQSNIINERDNFLKNGGSEV